MSTVDRDLTALLDAIVEKLKANRPEIARSLAHGRLSWRVRDGRIDITLDLTL